MFHHLNGTVTDLEPGLAVIECGGVGFEVNTTAYTLGQLHRGENAKLYICEQVREDAFDLYGFATAGERRCFEMLISVSGVGPKAAIAILSSNTPERVCAAIMSDDERILTSAPGVGKRLAQRIILELKDKIQKQSGSMAPTDMGVTMPAAAGGEQTKLSDLMSALTVLGYSRAECAAAIKGLDIESMTLEDAIRAALRGMMK